MTEFDPAVVAAVLRHMNGEHSEDNLLIVRAFGRPQATESVMVGVDGAGGIWSVTDGTGTQDVRVAWSQPITERSDIRREIVALYEESCRHLGVVPREA
ncbi:hypothetical protein GCM10022198_14910 [Klugiella xanthotipulae]|uniref:Uncharacterized protein DUF2470 n=1 Tax=Klugiella xanthotipulae TaxID=244735 RepID=A0A543I6M2_9MICO|nr:DUF2470 domain-containing protein [Klugiella xanthotipulae]TQM66217.1 uncharacterized protein DUF2470 [Klugiella xanthotipulae]